MDAYGQSYKHVTAKGGKHYLGIKGHAPPGTTTTTTI